MVLIFLILFMMSMNIVATMNIVACTVFDLVLATILVLFNTVDKYGTGVHKM